MQGNRTVFMIVVKPKRCGDYVSLSTSILFLLVSIHLQYYQLEELHQYQPGSTHGLEGVIEEFF